MASKRSVIIAFIKEYQKSECLWNVNDENYKNKYARLHAFEQLLKILKKNDETANVDTVKTKINTLRNCFNKEHNKVKASYSSEVIPEDVHVPKLWYYNLLLFLADKDVERRESTDVESVHNESLIDNQDGLETVIEVERSSTPFQHNVMVPQQNSPDVMRNLKRKIKTENEVSTNFGDPKALDTYHVSLSRPAFSAFGEHVAEKLRAMEGDAAKYCQKLINDAIFYAEFNNLNYTSRIVTDCLQNQSSAHFQHCQFSHENPSPPHRPPPQSTQTP